MFSVQEALHSLSSTWKQPANSSSLGPLSQKSDSQREGHNASLAYLHSGSLRPAVHVPACSTSWYCLCLSGPSWTSAPSHHGHWGGAGHTHSVRSCITWPPLYLSQVGVKFSFSTRFFFEVSQITAENLDEHRRLKA